MAFINVYQQPFYTIIWTLLAESRLSGNSSSISEETIRKENLSEKTPLNSSILPSNED
ncbi:hypothetical protein M2107_006457 [Paenibacillus sp. PastM-2]|nr:hypothetical protein [Paenibacillus sp. PastM-2]